MPKNKWTWTEAEKIWPRGQVITPEALRSFLLYDPATGVFTWSISRRGPGARQGTEAGRICGHGYNRIKIAGVDYAAHRLAWLYVYGVWPKGQIDHINGDRLDNRIGNLRDVSPSVNQQNRRRAAKNNRNGLLGVRKSRGGRFRAEILHNGHQRHLGCFATAEEAHEAYVAAKREMHPGCTL